MNDSFISVVEETWDTLLVRARKKEHLINLLGETYPIETTRKADYLYRALVPRPAFVKLMMGKMNNINYPNFKASVKDKKLQRLYADFWQDHHYYQYEC